MKNIQMLFLGIFFCYSTLASAQQMSKSKFDELWNKAEKGKIEAIDVTKSLEQGNPLKKLNNKEADAFLTQPIVNGKPLEVKPKIQEPIKTKEVIIVNPTKPDKATKQIEYVAPKQVEAKETKTIEIVTPKKTVVKEDFSTQPIVKEKKNIATPTVAEKPTPASTPIINNKIDTSKSFKKFSFETTPVINNNASYTRKNEPLPKSKEQIESEIPVNKTSFSPNAGIVTESLSTFEIEADVVRQANKRRADSILQSLNISTVTVAPNEFVDIYVSGGGVLASGNSKQYEHISILHSGTIQIEYKTVSAGVQRIEKNISKEALIKLAQYIADLGFFKFNKEYNCAENDITCAQRLAKNPPVVPLEVAVTIGQQRNKIKIALFAPSVEKNLVNYPPNLEKIVSAIYAVIGR